MEMLDGLLAQTRPHRVDQVAALLEGASAHAALHVFRHGDVLGSENRVDVIAVAGPAIRPLEGVGRGVIGTGGGPGFPSPFISSWLRCLQTL